MSTLNVNNINEAGGVDAVITAGVLDSGSLPAGSILQIVRATDSTRRSTNSTNSVDVTGMSVTITPQSSSSQIFILSNYVAFTQSPNGGNQWSQLKITDSSNVPISGAEDIYYGSRNIENTTSGDVQRANAHMLLAFDTPATTSAVTYKLRFLVQDVNTTVELMNDLTTGQMFAIEVAA